MNLPFSGFPEIAFAIEVVDLGRDADADEPLSLQGTKLGKPFVVKLVSAITPACSG
jgi:hypothetical protein